MIAFVGRSLAHDGAQPFPLVLFLLSVFNTENTEGTRSSTEKGNVALRAKLLKSPIGADEPRWLPHPETLVILRVIFVSSVLIMRR
jgi:hypothetical protein